MLSFQEQLIIKGLNLMNHKTSFLLLIFISIVIFSKQIFATDVGSAALGSSFFEVVLNPFYSSFDDNFIKNGDGNVSVKVYALVKGGDEDKKEGASSVTPWKLEEVLDDWGFASYKSKELSRDARSTSSYAEAWSEAIANVSPMIRKSSGIGVETAPSDQLIEGREIKGAYITLSTNAQYIPQNRGSHWGSL